jgi:hypothetical protein
MLLPERVDIDDTSTGWNVTLGYRINRYLAAELSYYDFGTASVTEHYFPRLPGLPTEITTRSELQVYGPGVAVLGSLPVTETVDLFARGGALFADQESVARRGALRIERRTGQEIWIAGVGAQWTFIPRWTARLEYQVSDSIDEDRRVGAGTTEVKQASLSVLFDF